MFNPNDVVKILAADRRSGPCEDDVEVTCPFVDMLPEESDTEEGSPLDFGHGERNADVLTERDLVRSAMSECFVPRRY